jgi:hypothetical protein
MGLLSRLSRKVLFDDLPMATKIDLNAWLKRATPNEIPVTRYKMADVAEHWAEDGDAVARYAAMDSPIPPILVRSKNGRLMIVDGNHRYNAALARGADDFEAINLSEFGW